MLPNKPHISEREALAIFGVLAPLYCQQLPLVLKLSEVSRLLKISRETLKGWIEAGKFIPEVAPGHYSTPALIYWIITNEFLINKSLEDRFAEQIAGEAVLSLTEEIIR